MMLMYGNGNFIPDEDKTIILNLASLREDFNRAQYLYPPREIGRLIGYDFDVNYAKYLMEYTPAFLEMFNLILHLYRGNDVFLIITDDDWTENLAESLFKFIQQRYGYNGVRVTDFSDYIHFNNQVFNFDPYYGIANFKADREEFSLLVERERLRRGGKPYAD